MSKCLGWFNPHGEEAFGSSMRPMSRLVSHGADGLFLTVYGLPEYTRIFEEAPTCDAQRARHGRCDTLPRRVSEGSRVSHEFNNPSRRDTRSEDGAG